MALPSLDGPYALKTVRNQIPYIELPGGSERFVNDGTECVRRLACYWNQRQDFILDVLGDANVIGGKLRRDLPEKHPDFDDDSGKIFSMWAREMTLVDKAGWPGRDSGTGALVMHDSAPDYTGVREENGEGLAIYDVLYRPTIEYMLTDEEADADPYLERSRFLIRTFDPGGENLTLPKGLLKFEGDTDANYFTELAPILFPNAILNYHWLMVPVNGFPTNTALGYFDSGTLVVGAMGSVNSAQFEGFKPGSLLCLPPQRQVYIHANTGIYLNVTYQFQYRPQGHSRFLRNSGLFERLIRIFDPTVGVQQEFDFTKIFDVSNP